jgi:hypothetical protein
VTLACSHRKSGEIAAQRLDCQVASDSLYKAEIWNFNEECLVRSAFVINPLVLDCSFYRKLEYHSKMNKFTKVTWTWFHINLGEKVVPCCDVRLERCKFS